MPKQSSFPLASYADALQVPALDLSRTVGNRNVLVPASQLGLSVFYSAAYWLDPKAQGGAVYDGSTSATTAVQTSLDVPYSAAYPTSRKYGKGASILARPGVAKLGALQVSTWSRIDAPAQQGSAVWVWNNSLSSGTSALLTYRADNDQSSSIGSQPYINGLVLHGDKANKGGSTATIHGLNLPSAGGADDAPVLDRFLVANFTGNGLNLLEHDQLRGINVKSIANDAWGFYADNSSDSKLTQVGMGRNLGGQVYMVDCASMQWSQYDIWTPSGGTFTGKNALELVSCRNGRFFQGEIQGVVRIEGDNSNDGVQTQHQDVGISFVGFNIKVSPETYSGTQYVGGGGSTAYDAMVQMRGANDVQFALGQFGYSQGPATAEELTATPKYVFEFTVPGGRDFAKEAGHVELTSVNFVHMHYVNGVRSAQVPFTRRIAKNPERLVWRTQKPGQLLMLPDATSQVNLIKLTGSTQTLNKADYPLLYLGMDDTRQLTDGATTFNLPATAGTLPSGYSWFVVAW